MNSREFREFGKAMVDYIADYIDNVRDRDVIPSVQPGYLQTEMPQEAPNEGERWEDVLKDVEKLIMPGITHWHSPKFHAYYPTSNSFPAVVGEMLSAGIGCIGFNWITSPACTELEVVTMNWLGKLLGLPEDFLNSAEGPGGGVIQGSASEATLVGLLAAKEKVVRLLAKKEPSLSEGEIKTKLVAYTSDQANSSVEKAGILASVPMIHLPTGPDGSLSGDVLRRAIAKDRASGLIPCYVVASLGTTGTCAFDNLEELAVVCKDEDIWLHVDAAYAGAAFVCPEYRHLMKGIELCDSFNFNPHKWMLVNFDCSALWVKNSRNLIEAFNVDRIYLQHQYEGIAPDYRHWQIPLGRRFRSLKLWFVLRIYGAEGIRRHIRHQISLAKHFEQLVNADARFEVKSSVMGLVCFRLKGANELTQKLIDKISAARKIYVIPCYIQEYFVIRFAICARTTTIEDIHYSWAEIVSHVKATVPAEFTNGI
ncbi:aromatic-L-amino-acid decarboxylase-like isoform X2 [Photinus pyralis]|uniref:Aromatic-L-amino-acid decarboxylase n=1 Tax=Photinus pyralis TaxID=7054 RepID=A0A1Y1L3F9_PHOPY|nr:aromatic-L-amino-acid decarboxylase-like isoform X2 [Photinus pyralis]